MRPWRRLRGPRSAGSPYEQLVGRALAGLEVRTAVQAQLFRLDGASSRFDDAAGTVTFTRPDGTTATATAQVVGALDPVPGTWRWSWADPSVRPGLTEHARLARAWGEENDAPALTRPLRPDTDDAHAWRLVAVTAELTQAQGVWRCPTGGAVTFVTLGALTLPGPPPAGGRPGPSLDDWSDGLSGLVPVAAPEAERVVRDFMAAVHDVELRYRTERSVAGRLPDPQQAQDAAVDRAIADKQPLYDRFWRREDEYHRPCSVGTIRWYDVAAMSDWRVYRLDDDAWRVTYAEPMTGPMTMPRAYDVRRFPDGLRIVDHLD